MIYASNVSALTFMELLSIRGAIVTSTKWILVGLEVLGNIPHLDERDLPSDWYHRPYPSSTQEFGTQWAQRMETPFLSVPSCRIPLSSYPVEHNLLINPLHAARNKVVQVVSTQQVSFALNSWQ